MSKISDQVLHTTRDEDGDSYFDIFFSFQFIATFLLTQTSGVYRIRSKPYCCEGPNTKDFLVLLLTAVS